MIEAFIFAVNLFFTELSHRAFSKIQPYNDIDEFDSINFD